MRVAAARPIFRRCLAAAVVFGCTLAAWADFGPPVVSITWMASDSMAPALDSAGPRPDVVLVDRLTPRLRKPRRGELVFFRFDNDWVIKRVAGLPGETIGIRQGRVWCDGKPADTPPAMARVHYRAEAHLAAGHRLKVLPGYYLLLGDNSGDSYDSRFWGCLAEADVAGYARAIVWPPSRARLVD